MDVRQDLSGNQQTDWTAIDECFDRPHILFGNGLSKTLQEIVKNAVNEMRRYYSRKVVDVLVKITKQSLEVLRKTFTLSGIEIV